METSASFEAWSAPSPYPASTLTGGVWTVSKNPVASFIYNGLRNLNWAFRDFAAVAPGCGIHGHTAHCAFSACLRARRDGACGMV